METRIELKFRDAAGNLVGFIIDEADPNLVPEDVRTAADAIIAVSSYRPAGYALASLASAVVIEKTTTELEVL